MAKAEAPARGLEPSLALLLALELVQLPPPVRRPASMAAFAAVPAEVPVA